MFVIIIVGEDVRTTVAMKVCLFLSVCHLMKAADHVEVCNAVRLILGFVEAT